MAYRRNVRRILARCSPTQHHRQSEIIAVATAELAQTQAAGLLPVDWLLTAAALKIRQGQIDDAAGLIHWTHDGKWPRLFASYVSEMTFADAARKHPEFGQASAPSTPQQATIRQATELIQMTVCVRPKLRLLGRTVRG